MSRYQVYDGIYDERLMTSPVTSSKASRVLPSFLATSLAVRVELLGR